MFPICFTTQLRSASSWWLHMLQSTWWYIYTQICLKLSTRICQLRDHLQKHFLGEEMPSFKTQQQRTLWSLWMWEDNLWLIDLLIMNTPYLWMYWMLCRLAVKKGWYRHCSVLRITIFVKTYSWKIEPYSVVFFYCVWFDFLWIRLYCAVRVI